MARLLKSALVAVVVAGLLSVALAAPADAGGEPSTLVRMKIARNANGPFKTQVHINLDLGHTKNAYLKVKSISGADEPTSLFDGYDATEVTQRYFTKNGVEITDAVIDSGYTFDVKAGKLKVFRLRLKRTGDSTSQCWAIDSEDTEGAFSTVTVFVNLDDPICF